LEKLSSQDVVRSPAKASMRYNDNFFIAINFWGLITQFCQYHR
jgi:hypothetical protein